MRKLLRIGSRGDTIIEILLSIAVLSLVLSVSYGLANRSSQTTRQAQERGEAQKLAEEQLEFLRGYVSPDQPWDDICFDASGNATSTVGECRRGPDGRYGLSIVASGNTYTVRTSWSNIKGGTDDLSLAYKLPLTGDIPATENFVCSDGIDNDEDGFIDHVSVNPSNPDPDCTSATGDTEITPLPDPIVNVVVRKIPPAAGSTTPSCSSAATQNKSGSSVRLQNASTNLVRSASGTPPTATFSDLNESTSYTTTVTAPFNYLVCPENGSTGSQNVTTGSKGTTNQLDFKIIPNCGPSAQWHDAYWAFGARQTGLDGYYYTWPPAVPAGTYPDADTRFVAGPPNRWYVWSGDWSRIGEGLLYYWVWDANLVQGYWANDGPNSCPS